MTDYPVNENGDTGETVVSSADYTMGENEEGPEKREGPGVFELIYGVLFNPVRTFRSIADDPPVFHGFLIFILVLIITSLVNILLPQDLAEMPPELAGVASQAGPSIVIVGAIMTTVLWFVQAGVLQVIAELLGGRGKAVGVLTVLALAGIPGLLMVPFRVAGYFLAESFAGSFLTIAGALLTYVWWVVLLVLGLRETQRFSTLKAVAAIIAPIVGIVLIITVTVITLFTLIAPLLNNFQ
ncbi:MAG TPA: Yip1 family protein [Desulfobacteria bacterium]|nr:Yip1 family protein [Desulfobacteria bacterium]